ncbi:MAG: hypothetical protein V1871_05345 [Planctomycetota bacterium]
METLRLLECKRCKHKWEGTDDKHVSVTHRYQTCPICKTIHYESDSIRLIGWFLKGDIFALASLVVLSLIISIFPEKEIKPIRNIIYPIGLSLMGLVVILLIILDTVSDEINSFIRKDE